MFAIVLIPNDRSNVPEQVDALLREYVFEWPSEESLTCACSCINVVASAHGRAVADARHGTLDAIVERHRVAWERSTLVERYLLPNCDHLQRAWQQTAEAAERAHPSWGMADPGCGLCRGTGRCFDDFPLPDREFTGYSIGGCYTGILDPTYDPTTDPRNLCSRGGRRSEGRACEPCQRQEGRELCHPGYWAPHERDIVPASDLLARFPEQGNAMGITGDNLGDLRTWRARGGDDTPVARSEAVCPERIVPAAVVTPDGVWREVRWDPSGEEMVAWVEAVRRLLASHGDGLAVVVHCWMAYH